MGKQQEEMSTRTFLQVRIKDPNRKSRPQGDNSGWSYGHIMTSERFDEYIQHAGDKFEYRLVHEIIKRKVLKTSND